MNSLMLHNIVDSIDIYSEEMSSLLYLLLKKAIKENNKRFDSPEDVFYELTVGEMPFAGLFGVLEIPPENQRKFYEEYSELQYKYKVKEDVTLDCRHGIAKYDCGPCSVSNIKNVHPKLRIVK